MDIFTPCIPRRQSVAKPREGSVCRIADIHGIDILGVTDSLLSSPPL